MALKWFSRHVKEAIGLLLHGMRRAPTVILDQKLLQKAYSQGDYSAAEHLILLRRHFVRVSVTTPDILNGVFTLFLHRSIQSK